MREKKLLIGEEHDSPTIMFLVVVPPPIGGITWGGGGSPCSRRCQPGEQACCISDTDNFRSHRQNLKVAIPVLPDFKTNLFIQKFVNLTYP